MGAGSRTGAGIRAPPAGASAGAASSFSRRAIALGGRAIGDASGRLAAIPAPAVAISPSVVAGPICCHSDGGGSAMPPGASGTGRAAGGATTGRPALGDVSRHGRRKWPAHGVAAWRDPGAAGGATGWGRGSCAQPAAPTELKGNGAPRGRAGVGLSVCSPGAAGDAGPGIAGGGTSSTNSEAASPSAGEGADTEMASTGVRRAGKAARRGATCSRGAGGGKRMWLAGGAGACRTGCGAITAGAPTGAIARLRGAWRPGGRTQPAAVAAPAPGRGGTGGSANGGSRANWCEASLVPRAGRRD